MRPFACIAVTAVSAVLASAPAAHSAMCISLALSHSRPKVRVATRIALRPFIPPGRGVLQPWIVRRYPFRVEAVSPTGRAFRVRVRPTRDPYVWSGVFSFPSPGRWHVRVTNFGPRYGYCGPMLRVFVRP